MGLKKLFGKQTTVYQMEYKKFTQQKTASGVLVRGEMTKARTPSGKTPTDFSSLEHQMDAHKKAGYELVDPAAEPIQPITTNGGELQIGSALERGVHQRWQKGNLYEKPMQGGPMTPDQAEQRRRQALQDWGEGT